MQLVSELKSMISEEREILVAIVAYLSEVDRRDLHLELGFPSLFDFCVRELGYSEWEAISRIRAMRLVADVPMALDALAKGLLSLTVASRVQACFRREKAILVPAEEKEKIVASLFGKKIREADRVLATYFPSAPPQERRIALSDELTKLELVISRALLEKLEKVQQLRSHKNPSKRLDLLFEDLIDLGLWHWDPAHPRWNKKKRHDSLLMQ